MKHGHMAGTKVERKPWHATINPYTAMSAAIATTFADKTPQELGQMLTMKGR
jgi:hypothetical protein